ARISDPAAFERYIVLLGTKPALFMMCGGLRHQDTEATKYQPALFMMGGRLRHQDTEATKLRIPKQLN
ncbi:MAG: hypothetical protein NT018_01310, partial [Armatimonadetes bacterium]|nr:hypothetical protein [Armatimonadota bacterium]